MTCEICGQGPRNGVTIHRINRKGIPGVWRCDAHLPPGKTIDPTVKAIQRAIEDQ